MEPLIKRGNFPAKPRKCFTKNFPDSLFNHWVGLPEFSFLNAWWANVDHVPNWELVGVVSRKQENVPKIIEKLASTKKQRIWKIVWKMEKKFILILYSLNFLRQYTLSARKSIRTGKLKATFQATLGNFYFNGNIWKISPNFRALSNSINFSDSRKWKPKPWSLNWKILNMDKFFGLWIKREKYSAVGWKYNVCRFPR